MNFTRIFPVNINIYHTPKQITSGILHSEEELKETTEYLINKDIYYTLGYRSELLQITHENNAKTTTGNV
jgi:hypothetical protein